MSDASKSAAAAAAVRVAEGAYGALRALPVAEPFLVDWPTVGASRPTVPVALPVLEWLPRAAAVAAAEDLVTMLAAEAGWLAWRQSYAAADFGADFLRGYGWTEIIGTVGPIASERLACGFLLLAPGITYPPHAHRAEELYLPLSGTALWQRGDAPFAPVAPGVPIHHPPWMPHAMRTRGEPLVALYLWRGGDLAAKPRITGQDHR